MNRIAILLSLLTTLSWAEAAIQPKRAIARASESEQAATTERQAPLFNDLGDYHYPISTTVPLAQQYFNQGLILAYGFNHAEAARSFREAARLDPKCAILKIASEVLAGQLAAKQGNYDQAVSHLKTATSLEDGLVYTEPADWYQPTRQALASVLLEAGRFAEAERVYRADLEIYPENGWSLSGLAQSLQAQGKLSEAQAVQARFEKAWQYADVNLTADK